MAIYWLSRKWNCRRAPPRINSRNISKALLKRELQASTQTHLFSKKQKCIWFWLKMHFFFTNHRWCWPLLLYSLFFSHNVDSSTMYYNNCRTFSFVSNSLQPKTSSLVSLSLKRMGSWKQKKYRGVSAILHVDCRAYRCLMTSASFLYRHGQKNVPLFNPHTLEYLITVHVFLTSIFLPIFP